MMPKLFRFAVPFAIATLAPALVIFAFLLFLMLSAGERQFGAMAVIGLIATGVSLVHVVLLGIPSIYLLHKRNILRRWTALLAGFVAGCIPMGVWSWPIDYSEFKSSTSYWDSGRMVIAKIDSVPAFAGWIDYVQGVGYMGLLGAIAGLSFWATWKRLGLQEPGVKR